MLHMTLLESNKAELTLNKAWNSLTESLLLLTSYTIVRQSPISLLLIDVKSLPAESRKPRAHYAVTLLLYLALRSGDLKCAIFFTCYSTAR